MRKVKMIAVDMDGTFLKSDMTYNKVRFMKQYNKMKQKGVQFVVASGNQYYQLKSFFPEIADEISFVAENGAFVVHHGKKIFNGSLPRNFVHEIMDVLEKYDHVSYILCGVESAYISCDVSDDFYAMVNHYYHRLTRVASLYEVEDTIFKFALITDEMSRPTVEKELQQKVGHIITPVTSGNEALDLIIPQIHKASGLMKLQALLFVDSDEIASFGDSHNDLEMLEHSGYSFAMANARPLVKKAAKTVIMSNDEEGVLNCIDALLSE